MRTVEFEHNGQVWHLYLNGAVLCEIYDKYGGEKSVIDPIQGDGTAAFHAVCWYLTRLAAQGELLRRWQGHERGPLPVEAAFRVTLSPLDVIRAKEAIAQAVAAGFGRQIRDERREIDLGLQELEQKKTAFWKAAAQGIFRRLRSFWAFLRGKV